MTEPKSKQQYTTATPDKPPIESLMLMRRKAHEMGIIVERQLLEMGALDRGSRLFVPRRERRLKAE